MIPAGSIPSAFATNENLYVSKDIAEQNIIEKYISQIDKNRSFIDGCSSFAPLNYDRVSFYRNVDQFNPTFDVGFFKNEYPITINSSTLTKSDFLDQSRTIPLQTSNPVTVKILLFSVIMDEIIKTSVEILTKKRAETKMMTNSVSFWI